MPGAGAYRSLISRLGDITRRAVHEQTTRTRVALKLSIDPGNLVRQPLLGVFLTDCAEPKINGHPAVVFVDDASTVTIDLGYRGARGGGLFVSLCRQQALVS